MRDVRERESTVDCVVPHHLPDGLGRRQPLDDHHARPHVRVVLPRGDVWADEDGAYVPDEEARGDVEDDKLLDGVAAGPTDGVLRLPVGGEVRLFETVAEHRVPRPVHHVVGRVGARCVAVVERLVGDQRALAVPRRAARPARGRHLERPLRPRYRLDQVVRRRVTVEVRAARLRVRDG